MDCTTCHWFFSHECQHIYSENRLPKTLKTLTTSPIKIEIIILH